MLASLLRRAHPVGTLQHAGAELTAIRRLQSAPKDGEEETSPEASTIDFGFQEVPVEQKQTLVGQVFSSVAPSYDVMNDLMSAGMHRLWKDRLVDSLAPFAGQRHLDVAGGTGDVAFRVYRAIREAERRRDGGHQVRAPTQPPASSSGAAETAADASEAAARGSVTVCDINAAMLREGEKKAAAQGVGGDGMQWVEGNAEALPFPDAAFDSYTIAFGIRNVTDRPAALAEAARVLRPGGRMLCLEFSKVAVPGLQQLYDLYSFSVIPEIGRLVAGDADSYRYLVESIRMFPGQEAFAGLLRGAGFAGVRYENLAGGVVAIHSGVNPRR